MNEKKLTEQQRGEKFQAEYAELVNKYRCQHAYAPEFTQEGRVVVKVWIQVVKDE